MHQDSTTVSECRRFVKNSDDLNKSLPLNYILVLSSLNVHFNVTTILTQDFYAKQTPFMFQNDICLEKKINTKVAHKVKIYMNKNYQNLSLAESTIGDSYRQLKTQALCIDITMHHYTLNFLPCKFNIVRLWFPLPR